MTTRSAILAILGVLLSLLTAISFGAADFSGGMATRRANVVAVVFLAQVIGLIGVTLAALLIAEQFELRSLGFGAIGGVFGLAGLMLLYRRLAAGPMSVVAPITAITSAFVPAAVAFARGDQLTSVVVFGLMLALFAIGLISSSDESAKGSERAPITARVLLESLGAGIGFGAFFVFINEGAIETAPWPIAGARMASVAVLVVWVALAKPAVPRDQTTLTWIVIAGIVDTFSNVLFLWSADLAGLAVASVISSFYPASTVLLALVVLGERISTRQAIGFALGAAATVLVAVG